MLSLSGNQLAGPIPPESGNLINLTDLFLHDTPLSGTLSLSLINLTMLNAFWFDNTDFCEPSEPNFQAWLQGIRDLRSTGCSIVSTKEIPLIPSWFSLETNHPNPFNPTTLIRYALPQHAPVHLTGYDVQGRRVAMLGAAEQPAGRYEITIEAGTLPSGLYFYRLEAGTFRAVRQMLLLR